MYNVERLIKLYKMVSAQSDLNELQSMYLDEFTKALSSMKELSKEQLKQISSYFEREGLTVHIVVNDMLLSEDELTDKTIADLLIFVRNNIICLRENGKNI